MVELSVIDDSDSRTSVVSSALINIDNISLVLQVRNVWTSAHGKVAIRMKGSDQNLLIAMTYEEIKALLQEREVLGIMMNTPV